MSGLCGNAEKGEKKRVAKLMDKIGGSIIEKPKKKPEPVQVSAVSAFLRPEQCIKCEAETDLKTQFDVLACHKCHKRYHGHCHEPALNPSLVKKQRPTSERQSLLKWECPDCKVCEQCHSATDENKIIICEMCDIAVHIHCLSPPLPKVPSKSWYCDACSQCLSCKV